MDELCPLCLKMGANKKIKAVQINLEEALWMCENEECPWPFLGQDEPTFLPRKVGEKWGYEWQTYRRVTERVGSVPVSMELSLYTPPVTPSGEASAKDSVQSDTANNNPNSGDCKSDFFLTDSSNGDSYAPRTVGGSSDHMKARTKKASKSAESANSQHEKDLKSVRVLAPLSRPSIFDIDGDKIVDDKINVELRCDSKSANLVDGDIAVSGVRKSETLPTFANGTIESIREIEERTFESDGHVANDSRKSIPQIRSIVRADIDLQILESNTVKKIDRPESPEVVDSAMTRNRKSMEKIVPATVTNRKSPEKIVPATLTNRKSPEKIAPSIPTNRKSPEKIVPSIPTNRKSPEKIVDTFPNSKHTTTITLDGIFPITLSYDLTDLKDRSEKNFATTSTPISHEKSLSSTLSNNDRNEESAAKIPKTPTRPVAKRRIRQTGKTFQKFSFNALRKVETCSNPTNETTVIKTESQNSPEIDNLNRTAVEGKHNDCPAKNSVASGDASTTSPCETINSCQIVQPLNSSISDANNSVAVLAADGLNVNSLLDDMFMDNYQNATQDLDDDWLTSFFNENT